MAPERSEKVRRFKEALRLNPNYSLAALQLGRAYYAERDYEQAAQWFAKVPRTDPLGREASFYQGLSQYYTGEYAKAEEAFQFLASRLPLTEVYNNLGVVAGRRGKRAELEYFQKAVSADPSDADYRFNLAVALYKFNDAAGAVRQLREVVNLRPSDGEARSLLESLTQSLTSNLHASAAPGPGGAGGKAPLERVKRNYDETSFQQLELEIQNATELRLSKTDPHTHAAFHAERGHQLLESGFVGEAEREFREAVMLDPTNIPSHAGLARVLLQNGDANAARAEADATLRLGDSAEALLVLAQLALNENRADQAQQNVDRALALEPNNPAAQALKAKIDARLADKK
jgi:tetratricopeptide (TPR) repeat protein